MHQTKPFLAIHRGCHHTQTAEIVEQVIFDMVQPRFCLTHGLCFNAEGQVFGLGQTVITLGQLLFQNLAVLGTGSIEAVLSERDTDALFKALRIGTHVHKGQLKLNRAVEEIQETAPFIENGGFILLLCQLIVDVLKLYGLGVVAVCDPADTVREHSLKGNGLLGGLGNPIVFLCPFYNSLNFSLLLSIQICRHFYFPCLRFLLEKQFAQPPFQVDTDAPERRNSCSSDKVEP